MSFSCAISAASTGITDGDFDFAVGKPNTKITRRCRILRAARYELCLPIVNDRIPSVEYFLWVCPFNASSQPGEPVLRIGLKCLHCVQQIFFCIVKAY